MKYCKHRHYRDQEVVFEKETVTLEKKVKQKSKKKKVSLWDKVKSFFKKWR